MDFKYSFYEGGSHMKSKMMNNLKRKINRGMRKSNVLMEMAQDFMDLVSNAKSFKNNKNNKKK
jgi:hypothetical protein